MITLHALYETGSAEVKAAVLAFGERHRQGPSGMQPDWDLAQKHFTRIGEILMGQTAPGITTNMRTQHAAVGFLLAITQPHMRCPVCRMGSLRSGRAWRGRR